MRCWLICFICTLCAGPFSLIIACAQQNPINPPVSTATQMEDSKKHLEQFFKALKELPRKQQNTLIKESNEAFASAMKSNPGFAAHHKTVAKTLSIKSLDELPAKFSSFDQIDLGPTLGLRAIELKQQITDQVVVDHLPAYANQPASPGNPTGTIVPFSYCATQAFFIPMKPITDSLELLRKVANSVARIEPTNKPDFIGTAFVISKTQGILATACHNVSEFASYSTSDGRWTLPTTPDIVADFGETADRQATREFRVTGVDFVPNLDGCDAALIKVDTTALDGSGQLPDAVPLAPPQLYNYPIPGPVGCGLTNSICHADDNFLFHLSQGPATEHRKIHNFGIC